MLFLQFGTQSFWKSSSEELNKIIEVVIWRVDKKNPGR